MDVRLPPITEDPDFVGLLLRVSTDPLEAMTFAESAMDTLRAAEALDFEAELACPICKVLLSDAARLACGACAS